jgi:hypothetical protein
VGLGGLVRVGWRGKGQGELTHHPMLGRLDKSAMNVRGSVVGVGGCTVGLILRTEGEASTRIGCVFRGCSREGGVDFSASWLESPEFGDGKK